MERKQQHDYNPMAWRLDMQRDFDQAWRRFIATGETPDTAQTIALQYAAFEYDISVQRASEILSGLSQRFYTCSDASLMGGGMYGQI